ncbi:response regulator transcription factor [Nocardia sp. IFM 10818]
MAILWLLAEGLTNREIAVRMFWTEKTVKNYVTRVLGRLRRRTQAAILAARVRDVRAHPRDTN